MPSFQVGVTRAKKSTTSMPSTWCRNVTIGGVVASPTPMIGIFDDSTRVTLRDGAARLSAIAAK